MQEQYETILDTARSLATVADKNNTEINMHDVLTSATVIAAAYELDEDEASTVAAKLIKEATYLLGALSRVQKEYECVVGSNVQWSSWGELG